MLHAVAIFLHNLLAFGHLAGIEQCGDDRVAAQPNLVDAYLRRLQGRDDGVEAEGVAVDLAFADSLVQVVLQLECVVGRKGVAYLIDEVVTQVVGLNDFLFGKAKGVFFHNLLFSLTY